MSGPDPTSERFPRKFGKYHLLGPLAQGGMGALYLAVTGDRGLERMLVIKTILPHLADAEYVARFRDEAKVVVKLSHGNLIPVFDAGQVEGELFLAMDFVEGKDLRAVWNRCARKGIAFPINVAVYLVKELCRGLSYAHNYGDLQLVHRDVSPPNILMSYSGEVKLTDFGLASSTLKLEKTAPGIIYGKVAYMSPEQARGEQLDGRSDLYAAGIILWELLTGRQLFPPGKEQPQELIKRAKNPRARPPSERAPRVPPALDGITLKALEPAREDRYQTVDEFRQALSGWLAREAPSTDAGHIEEFLHRLFDEDIAAERDERQRLIGKARKRASTLPATDELRQALGSAASATAAEDDGDDEDGPRGRAPGRRATDRGDEPQDRRQSGRRSVDQTERGLGVAVDVPVAGPGGRTVITGPSGEASAMAELAEAEYSDRPPSSAVGNVLDTRYRLDELLGEGGMGRVFLAEHIDIGKRVAVKILHQVYSRMPELVERFRHEARAASRIGHPHIVDVTDSGTTDDGSVYFVMEHLEGVELADVIERQGALAVGRALRISSQICRALAAAHAVSIIHRDLKPENIFLTTRGDSSDFVKVLDFGIAKSAEAESARDKRLTHPGMAMGTPEYMSPEQAAGKPADERCDIYAVGAILYEMLTGSPPYEGENFMEILTKKATSEPRPAQELNPDLPPEVVTLLERAMAREPEERMSSMEEFDYEVTRALAGRGAAVARILGLNADPDMLRQLNPGFPLVAEMDGWDTGNTPVPMFAPTSLSESGVTPGRSGAAALGNTEGITAAIRAVSSRSGLRWGAAVGAIVVVGGVLFYALGGGGSYQGERAPATSSAVVGDGGQSDAGTAASAPAEDGGAPAVDAAVVETDAAEALVADASGEDAGAAADAGAPVDSPPDAGSSSSDDGKPQNRREADRMLRRAARAKADLRWDEARALYRRVARSSYRSRSGYLGLAEVAFETKQLDRVLHYATKAGKSSRALMLIGHAYYRRGQYARAIQYYDMVLKADPGHKEAREIREQARQRLRQ